jgi:GxxExxY protein
MEINSIINDVIKSAYEVHNEIGFGLSEKIYQKSLEIVLAENGINAFPQHSIQVFFRDHLVGEYFADLFVQDGLIVELKQSPPSIPHTSHKFSTTCEPPENRSVY